MSPKRSNKSSWETTSSALQPHRSLLSSRLPSNQQFRLKYSEFVTLNPAAGTWASNIFRANDMFDPNFSGTGHQPNGFDQIMLWYNHFSVLRSRCRITASQPTLTSTGLQVAGLALSGGTGDVPGLIGYGLDALLEGLPEQQVEWGFCGTTGNSVTTRFKSQWMEFDSKQFFGKKVDVLNANFQGSTSASPVEQAFFTAFVGAWDGASDTDSIRFLVEIEFDAVFSEPKPLPAS